ncbi:MAG: Lrp/AsnC family transcriptional regulator [Lachnospiraceae bacterium]|nr:Lrp/AsnC family transcriptional regulator [Lachnospiraceae bacterium]MCI9599317.1 Lrp/AsnC family transcriptional regulator [Lachnospiraceae bacterium]MDE6895848.1 Lrp/AsnC family transcriptional regulator [Lachnospiraceae bacterium]
MDSMDRSILKCLSENSRQSATEISRTVHLSIAAVIERIRKLERNGIIRQYTIVTDQRKMGNEVTALMEVSLEHPGYYEGFTKAMRENDHIVSCDYLTGDYDFMLKIQTRSSETLEQLHRMIKSIKGVSGTKTYFVLKQIKSGLTAVTET